MTDVEGLATRFGGVIGDKLPGETGFVLLVFKPGPSEKGGGLAWSTNTEAVHALAVLKAFVQQVEAAVLVASTGGG